MKRYLLVLAILLVTSSLKSQTIANLAGSGTGIKWYAAPTGGSSLAASTALVNGTTYYGSQTVNGVESSIRLAVTATVTVIPVAPTAAAPTLTQTQIDWKWLAASGATGYKWSVTNNYGTATDLGNVLVKSESGLTCGTSYTRYLWAYNTTACASAASTLTQTTSACLAEIAGGAASVCVGSTTPAFTNATSDGTWSISNGGSYASINSNGIVTGLSPGSATVAYTLSGNTVTAAITVNALPNPTFTVQPGTQTSTNFLVYYTTQSGKLNYVWTYPGTLNIDYMIYSGGGNTYSVALYYKTIGYKTVTINYTDINGCTAATATSSIPIDVYEPDTNQ